MEMWKANGGFLMPYSKKTQIAEGLFPKKTIIKLLLIF